VKDPIAIYFGVTQKAISITSAIALEELAICLAKKSPKSSIMKTNSILSAELINSFRRDINTGLIKI